MSRSARLLPGNSLRMASTSWNAKRLAAQSMAAIATCSLTSQPAARALVSQT